MTARHAPDALIADAHVDAILAALNASESGLKSLEDLTSRTCLRSDRIIEGPDITYVRLVGQAEQGGPIVLVHFEGIWERATSSSPPPPVRACTSGQAAPRPMSRQRERTRARLA